MNYKEIRTKRIEFEISQTKLAEYSGYTKSQISRFELEKDIPTPKQLAHLHSVLNDLIQKVTSGELNLKGHRVVRQGKAEKTSHPLIKSRKEYEKKISALGYDSEYKLLLSELMIKAKKDKKELKGIGLFSGCGGLDLGFEAAGVNIVGHVEIWDAANKIYAENFPNAKLLGTDINAITLDDIDQWNNEFGEIDIVIGGPPCQGFSLAGKRDPEDIRNELYQQYVKVVENVHPKVFVFENVAKMTSMKNKDGGLFLDNILEAFARAGYSLKHKIINAYDFGVPQSRERVFLVGLRNDLDKTFVFNDAKFSLNDEDEQMAILPTRKVRTFRDATSDLESLENGESSDDPMHFAIQHPQHVIDWLIDVPEGKSAHDNEDPAKRPPSGFNTTYKRIVMDEPCSTISTNFSMISGCRNVHPYNTRSLTIREATRAQSFPDEFVFCGKWGDIRKAIGNAVPPLLAYEIATEIIDQVF